jgi:diguanylate cyclase (GGDEF)-like protein/PAS domain S-box-containing protein
MMKSEQLAQGPIMHDEAIRAVLIDDDEDDYILTRDLIAEIDRVGIDLTWASGFDSALTTLDASSFDVLLIDYRLGERSGIDLLREIRARGNTTPAIMLTGLDEQDLDLQVLGAGAADFLEKGRATSLDIERAARYALEHGRTLQALQQAQCFLSATINALSAHIAILDARGVIVEVNDAWRAFGDENDLRHPQHAVGVNYLEVCEHATGRDVAGARQVARGIRAVLRGERDFFYWEYPCHSATEQRWFAVRVTRQAGSGPPHVVVAHESITEQREAQQRLNELVNGLNVIIWESSSPDGPCTYINDSVETLLGYSREQWLSTSGFWMAILHPDDREWVLAQTTPLQMEGRAHELEYRVVAADGRVVWVRDIVHPVVDELGSVQRQRGLMLDITERKLAEEERRRSDERFRTLFEHAPIGIVTMNAEGRVIAVNDAYQRMMGYSADELLMMPFGSPMHPDEVQVSLERFQQLVAGERGYYTVEKRYLRKDGSLVWGRLAIGAVRDTVGRFLYSVSMIEDITEERKATQALRESEHRFRSLVQNATDMVIIAGLDGVIQYVSPSFETHLGYPSQDISGTNLFALIAPEDIERSIAAFSGLMTDPERIVSEVVRVRHADGSWRWIESTGRNLIDDPSVGGIVANMRDVTDSKRHEIARQLLAEASAALGSSLDYTATLEQVARISVPTFADWCVVSMLDDDGVLRRLAVVHANPKKQPLADQLKGYPPSDPDMSNGVPYAVRTGQTVLNVSFPAGHWDTIDNASQRHLLPALGVTSSLIVPLWVRGEVVGAIALQYGDSGRQYDERDVPVAEELARRAGVAIENAQLHREVAAAEKRFRSLVQHASDMIAILDGNGVILYESPAIEVALGYCPEDVVGKHCLDLLHPDEAEGIASFLQDILAQPDVALPLTYRVRHADGSWRWLEATVTNLLHEPGIHGIVVNARDITERRRAEEAIRKSEARFRSAFDDASIGMAIISLERKLMAVNPAFCRMFGYAANELVGRTTQKYSHPDDRAVTESTYQQLASGVVQTTQLEKRYLHRSGATIWCEVNMASVRDDDGTPLYLLAQLQDITARKHLETQLIHQALHDNLTGLPNRTLLLDRLDHANAVARRHGGMVGVLFLDLDNFKLVNDSLGHAAGDALLLRVAKRLRGCVREDDTVARFGGDEFVIVLGHIEDPGEALDVAQRITNAFDAPLRVRGRDIIMTTSIGIALSPGGTIDRIDLLRNADIAMYRAKSSGKAAFLLFDEHMHDIALQRLELEHDLRRALERDEFELHFQPIIALTGREVVGLEALVRWRHPQQGLVSPADFIPIAEETGLIVPLGQWVLREACQQAAGWQRDAQVGGLRVSVNLSARQFRDPELVEQVRHALEASGLAPHLLVLELTESNVMSNADEAVARLEDLRQIGVRIAIDDFGTGYSSLAYLHSFPVEILKIDRSFIARIGAEKDSTPIISATVSLAQALGMAIVAEGVETEAQVLSLRAFGCDHAQGYIFSPPIPAERVPHLLQQFPTQACIAAG